MQIPIDVVQAHAGRVDQAGDAMREARSAVAEVTMDTQAYGQLCQFLPGLMSPLFALASGALNRSVDALGETAVNLRTSAREAAGADTASSRRIDTAGRPRIELPL
jgi:hypothetical protein